MGGGDHAEDRQGVRGNSSERLNTENGNGERELLLEIRTTGKATLIPQHEVFTLAERRGLSFPSWQLRWTATIPFALVASAGAHICGAKIGRTRLPIVNHRRSS
jgi:hypothetical protein